MRVVNSLWWNPGERRERGGARLTRRVREEYRVYSDRNATMSGAKRRGSAGMHRRSNAAWVSPQAVYSDAMPPRQSLHRDPSLIPLSHQHQHGLAITVLIDRGLKADPSREKALELAGKVARLAEVELLGHFQVEERVLFPAVRPFLKNDELLDALIAEHRVMETLVQSIVTADDQERIPFLKQFAGVLHRHIRTEERQLFQEIQARLDEAQLAELGREIAARVEAVCPLGDKLPWAKE